ncbi:MAG: DNA polymerase III subunit alpha [Gammaproteobacteria bacterium]|nr:DNA polymerase III subunit alpha [Gammaproteobacteria bacterium]
MPRASAQFFTGEGAAVSASSFVHLHVHTEYSLVDSTVRIPALMTKAAADGMPAVAMTDRNNLFGLVKFYRRAIAAGVKPIIGADLRIANEDDPGRAFTLIVLCQDNHGYRNLCRIISRAYLEGRIRGEPMIRREWLDRDSCEGLIALSGGLHGDVGHSLLVGHLDEARQRLVAWRDIFDDRYYLELTRTGRGDEEGCVQASLLLASEQAVPVVASNDVRFIEQEDFHAHEARVCIHDGRGLADPDRPHHYSNQQYLRSSAEMIELFSDVPEAVENGLEIARRCNLDLKLGESVLPAFPVPEGQTEEQFLEAEARRGLEKALEEICATRDIATNERDAFRAPYLERLETELRVIRGMGFPGYFLIVADFIRWARNSEIPVGPGRGSGAGSLVAWVLGITDLDPLEHDLLFERFLNPERVSMPDFDIDFCMEGRDRVIEYVAERYGRDRVAQIITFGTMAARAVIRDTGRVLGQPYGFVDRIAKLVPFEIGMTLDKALEQSDELATMYRDDEEVTAIIDLAKSLEGLVRNAGKHAGGVVIAPDQLTDFAPLYCEDGGSSLVTQLDKDDVEAIGLVKFDFLGLKTLTVIDWAERIVNATYPDESLDISRVPMDDAETFRLLQSTQTAAVFQLESSGMRDLIKRLRPDQFGDLRHGRRFHCPQALVQSGRDRLPASGPQTRTRRNLRRDPLPGAGHADRAGAGRLHPGWRRSLAACDGQEEARGDGETAGDLHVGRDGAWRGRADSDTHFRPDGEICRLRVQQVAFCCLRGSVLPDRVPEGALSGRIHGGGNERRPGQHRPVGDAQGRLPQARPGTRSAERRSFDLPFQRGRRPGDSLWARRDQGSRTIGGRSPDRRARGER